MIRHVFRLSTVQEQALAQLSDGELRSLIPAQLIDALEQGTLAAVRIRQLRPRNYDEEAVSGSPAGLRRGRLVEVSEHDELALPSPAMLAAPRPAACEVSFLT